MALLFGCDSEENVDQNDLQSTEEPTDNQPLEAPFAYDEENPPSFEGEIVEIYGDNDLMSCLKK